MMLIDIYSLSVQSSGFGAELNYMVVKDYCKSEELGVIKIWRILKRILNAIR